MAKSKSLQKEKLVKKKLLTRTASGKLRKLEPRKDLTKKEFIGLIKRPALKFKSVAENIRHFHVKTIEEKANSLGYAFMIGELLVKQKKEVGYGKWMDWMEKNLSFSRQWAVKYIKVFENRELLLANAKPTLHLTFTAAAKQLEIPKDKKPKDTKKKLLLRRSRNPLHQRNSLKLKGRKKGQTR